MKTIRPAQPQDLQDIMAVLEAAKGIMRASGNREQWSGGYPSEEAICLDIRNGHGFVVTEGARAVGYFAFIPSPEPTYARIYEGAWEDDTLPYHVVHRIGSYPEVHGVFKAIMDWCFQQDGNIRIDTHRDNLIMQHVILRYGFHYCGIIHLASGDERLAYQKMNYDARDARVNLMSAAFRRLGQVSAILTEKVEELDAIAPDVDLLKEYVVSEQWLADFEADEKGQIGPGVDRSVLSEDGLYDLMRELDDLMRTFERLRERFATDPELDKRL